jgi:hypothetical protein
MDSSTYFANFERDRIGDELHKRIEDFFEEMQRCGRLGLWQRVHRYYFALDSQGYHQASEIRRGGEQGELSILKANHFRNLLQHLHVLVTQQRPSFECRALNTDYKSQIQTILGRNILEYYLRECRLDAQFRLAAEVAIAYAESYVEIEWDKNKGDEYAADVDTGEIIYTGDISARVYEPLNVIRPCRAGSDADMQDWYILQRRENKYDLAAVNPELADRIIQYSDDTNDPRRLYVSQRILNRDVSDEYVTVSVFYHKKTPACPTGRIVKFLGPDLVLNYSDLTYPVFPVIPMMPAREHGSSFGYSVSFDLLCVQEAVDLLYSTVLSNQATFGVQNVWMKPGSNLSATQLAGGLNVLESAEKPEPINLTNTPPEIFNFLKGLEQLGQVLSGVNSVARGTPEASLKSGAALALVASQAVQFSNGLQAAYARLLEDSGTAILRTLQTRASLPRAALIAGKNNKSYLKDFTGDDLKSINRVIVDLGNPVSRTVAGRIQMAQDLLQAQVIKKPEDYIQVIETGSTEPMVSDQRAEELLIDSENEALRDGKPVVVTAVDEHLKHIQCHKAVLAGNDERMDPALVDRVLAHIQEHITQLRTVDPALLNALGQAPIAVQPNGAPTPPQGANAPQPNAQPQPGQQMPAPAGTPPEVAAQMPELPTAPNTVPGMSPAA